MNAKRQHSASLFKHNREKRLLVAAADALGGVPLYPMGFDYGFQMRNEATGVVTTWVSHWWLDVWEGSRVIAYVFKPDTRTLTEQPQLAGYTCEVY